MRRKALLLAAVACVGMLILTACTAAGSPNANQKNTGSLAENESQAADDSQENAGLDAGSTSGTTQEISGTVTSGFGSTGSGSSTGSGNSSGSTGTAVAGYGSGASGTASGGTGGSGSSSTDQPAGGASESQKESTSEEDVAGEFHFGGQDGSEDSGTADKEDIWSGTYTADEESVTIVYLDEETLSFSFSQAGISGQAEVNGSQAVYRGDDYYLVVFNVSNGVLDVSVSSEEDYDASGSPLIGTYIKQ